MSWTNCGNCGKRLKEDIKEYCDEYCKQGTANKSLNLVSDDATWNGVWENIAWEPITITGGRRELMEVCKKHGVAPKALLKPKSQGRGFEIQEKRCI